MMVTGASYMSVSMEVGTWATAKLMNTMAMVLENMVPNVAAAIFFGWPRWELHDCDFGRHVSRLSSICAVDGDRARAAGSHVCISRCQYFFPFLGKFVGTDQK
jgi:hypothetical protein